MISENDSGIYIGAEVDSESRQMNDEEANTGDNDSGWRHV